jgi:hypothetical protein
MEASMMNGADKQQSPLARIKRCVKKNSEILITLQDRSTVTGTPSGIVGYKEIQFCWGCGSEDWDHVRMARRALNASLSVTGYRP